MRQILYHFGELPLDLSTKIKKLIELNDYWLFFYDDRNKEHLFDLDGEHFLRRSLDGRRPPTINIRLVFGSKSRKVRKEIPSTWIKMFLSNPRYFLPSTQVVDFIEDVKKFSMTKEESLAKMKRDKRSIATVHDTMEWSLSSMDSITADGEEGIMDDNDKDNKNEDQVIVVCEDEGHSVESCSGGLLGKQVSISV